MNTNDVQLPPLPEPDAYLFQHEETGLTEYVDSQQVEWGFEKANPRWQKMHGAFTERQLETYARAAIEADRKRRGEPTAAEISDVIREITGCPDIKNGENSLVVALRMLFHRGATPQPAEPTFTTPDCPRCGCVQDGQCLCNPSRPSTEPVKVPSDSEIFELAHDFSGMTFEDLDVVGFGRALLARYGKGTP